MEKENKKIRTLKGIVVSDKMQKTVVVSVTRLRKHPKYKKYYKITSRYKAHDENGDYHTGDKVVIKEIRPMSKDKRWIVISK
ncbi:MAG: 30S ribosomal protein S17 [Candidatus Paceibacterota bacterium]